MLPSNNIYYDPPKLRVRLDRDGFLYFKNIIPREVVNRALDDVATQMVDCGWTLSSDREKQAEKNGFAFGVPFPSTCSSSADLPPPKLHLSEPVRNAVCGTTLMSVVRQVYSGAVHLLPHHSIDLSEPGEGLGFRMPSVYMNRGTKLALVAWVPLQDVPLHLGSLCVARGSNSNPAYQKIRETYGSHDVEGSGIAGDGTYTMSPEELLPIGKRPDHDEITGAPLIVDDTPFVSTTFEAGDVVLMTMYTMYGFLTNRTDCWRISADSYWIMEGDDQGADPRYWGDSPVGLSKWHAERHDPSKYGKTMAQAKKEWGLITPVGDVFGEPSGGPAETAAKK